jgi:signal transduction histidine kinase
VQSIVVPLVYWFVIVIIPATIGPLLVLDRERVKLEQQIASENETLSKEITIFEQKLWVFRRRWLFMLHGTVQAALTAALTRLQTFSETDPYQASLVRADLDRAAKALQELPSDEIDFAEALEELKAAWDGVCSINVSVDMRAERALKSQRGTAYCVNEIAKEAIGNAVRHGGATAVSVKITRPQDDIIELEFENNGVPVTGRARKKGIGSRMLDDITLSWSLKREGKLTMLRATLPL